jgi:hypothetical protein
MLKRNYEIKMTCVDNDVLTAVTMKSTIFWEVTLCSMVFSNVLEEHTASTFRLSLLAAWLTLIL